MSQRYKTVYFADMPAESAKQKSLTIAFGKKSQQLYSTVKSLSSEEVRQLLGTESYLELVNNAHNQDLSVNTYCVRTLRKSIHSLREKQPQLVLPGLEDYTQFFDPVTVTFKGGAKEPFIRWYPYLEGYSPQFVQAIFEKYAPDAHRILDPFAGTGTTAFTAAQLNKQAFFCEINPVLQFISLTKITVRQLDERVRSKLANDLVKCTHELGFLSNYKPDYYLELAYRRVFGVSKFFDDVTYQDVLRLRSWIDDIALNQPLLANLLTIAVLSALVPASKLKRAGDLRYKTQKESSHTTVSLTAEVRRNIAQIAEDIKADNNGLQTKPVLICENAHTLSRVPNLDLDAIITSPPYVNGTNYFRNTKIELWFLRCLLEKKDLNRFRSMAITSGINDVTTAKVPDELHPDVETVVRRLEDVAYDVRIPRMIASYFHEMSSVFRALRMHLRPGGIVAVDIGDSVYAGVHVPSDSLLSNCLHELDFEQGDEIVLRNRRSRSGMLLKQSLLVFKYHPSEARFFVKHVFYPWHPHWASFKQSLPHQTRPYTKRNWGHPRHSLCSYLGKLKPAIAHHLVKVFVPEGGRVLDPFAGVGTIPFEAALQGKLAYGFDISPAAYAIASAKVQEPTQDNCFRLVDDLAEYLKSNSPTDEELAETQELGFNGKVAEYYARDTLNEIILARRFFLQRPPKTPEQWFVLASLLHVLHGNRPYALSRRSHPITPYKPSGPFHYRSLIQSLKEKVGRGFSEKLPRDFKPGKMFFQDATGWWPGEIEELDAIITSPPFFDSTRFYLANWLRLWFAGWSKNDFEMRPLGFVDERQKTSFDIYIPIFRQARERLKRDGVLVFHLGKSAKCDMAAELSKLGRRWFRFADVFDESVAHCESHGIRDKGTVTFHQYLVLY